MKTARANRETSFYIAPLLFQRINGENPFKLDERTLPVGFELPAIL
jgi:hypothetical protein